MNQSYSSNFVDGQSAQQRSKGSDSVQLIRDFTVNPDDTYSITLQASEGQQTKTKDNNAFMSLKQIYYSSNGSPQPSSGDLQFELDRNSNALAKDYHHTSLDSTLPPDPPSAESHSQYGKIKLVFDFPFANQVEASTMSRHSKIPKQNPESKFNREDQHNTENSAMKTADSSRDKVRHKSSHNVIEQRYRNKINDKFTALQHSVPTLRAALERKEELSKDLGNKNSELEVNSDLGDSISSLGGLEPARKLNKGTILAKTVEYIKFLEEKNKGLTLEYQQINARAKTLGFCGNDDLNSRQDDYYP